VIALDHGEVDFGTETLRVRDTKFGKTRELPLHASIAAALRDYHRREDRERCAGQRCLLRLDEGRAPALRLGALGIQEAAGAGRDDAGRPARQPCDQREEALAKDQASARQARSLPPADAVFAFLEAL